MSIQQQQVINWANDIAKKIDEPVGGKAAHMIYDQFYREQNLDSTLKQVNFMVKFASFVVKKNNGDSSINLNMNDNNNGNKYYIDLVTVMLSMIKQSKMSNQIHISFNQNIENQTVGSQTVHTQNKIDTQLNTNQNIHNSTISINNQTNTNCSITNIGCVFRSTGMYILCIHNDRFGQEYTCRVNFNHQNQSLGGAHSRVQTHCNYVKYHVDRKPNEKTINHYCGECYDNPSINYTVVFVYDIKNKSFSNDFMEHICSTHLPANV